MMRVHWLLPLFLAGCLTSTHVLPDGELMRLASLPPEERGRRVRVVQGFSGAEEPPEAPHVSTGAVIVYSAPVRVGGGYGYGYGSGYARPSAKSMKDDAKWWIAIAAITAVGLAVTEGMRYDGWVALNPMHPIHLFGPGGEWSWVPLAQLDAGTAAWARKAFVREQEGPWQRLERAPLDRVGLTYSLLMGTGEVPAFDGVKRAGFVSHIQVGFFPLQQLGLLFDMGLGWRTDRDYSDIFHSRYSFEIQVLPLAAGRFHAGAYGQFGTAYRFEDFPPTASRTSPTGPARTARPSSSAAARWRRSSSRRGWRSRCAAGWIFLAEIAAASSPRGCRSTSDQDLGAVRGAASSILRSTLSLMRSSLMPG
jgi:hypothetical protein